MSLTHRTSQGPHDVTGSEVTHDVHICMYLVYVCMYGVGIAKGSSFVMFRGLVVYPFIRRWGG